MCRDALRGDGRGLGWSKKHLNHSVRGSLQAGQVISGSERREGRKEGWKESYGDAGTVLRCSLVNPIPFLLQGLSLRTIT